MITFRMVQFGARFADAGSLGSGSSGSCCFTQELVPVPIRFRFGRRMCLHGFQAVPVHNGSGSPVPVPVPFACLLSLPQTRDMNT